MINTEGFMRSLQLLKPSGFERLALEVFRYQYDNNTLYHHYCQLLNRDTSNVKKVRDIPFLPIQFFKSHEVKTGEWDEKKIFLSSGTTGMTRSKHLVCDEAIYNWASKAWFEKQYGDLADFTIAALLPNYQQQGNSSLIHMVDFFMKFTKPDSAYCLEKPKQLEKLLNHASGRKLLMGVSYALVKMADCGIKLPEDTVVLETGGMKGRHKEWIREELHQYLKLNFGVRSVQSEYGMTELFSQAYTNKNGQFAFPSWARVFTRDIYDPFQFLPLGKTGGINVVDLANVHTCSFIETQDLGILHSNKTFSVLGRFDNSELRGCNLLTV